jgi:ribosome biogenesis protein SLX9
MKRKAKEQLTGGLDDLQSALATVEMETTGTDEAPPTSVDTKEELASKSSVTLGKIGKSGSSTLSKAQRKRVL